MKKNGSDKTGKIMIIGFLLIFIFLTGLFLIRPLAKRLSAPATGIRMKTGSGEAVSDIEERTIVIDGLKETYHFLYCSDLHITSVNDEVSENSLAEIQSRYDFHGSNGYHAAEILPKIVEKANELKPDAVLLGGDMIDFLSKENAKILSDGLSELEVPCMFVTADHDTFCWWTDYSVEEEAELKKLLDTKPVQTMDFDEFIVLGVSDNTSRLTPEAVAEIKDVFAKGKPVIVVQHVPIDSDTEDAEVLRTISASAWNERLLLWGDNCDYVPDEPTAEYINLLKDPSSKVAALLTGHIHVRYEGKFNENATQYIFNPAYSGEIAYFTVTGNEK